MNASPRAPSAALIRVLVVGDAPSDLRLITDLLDSRPDTRFLVDWARNLADGLDRLATGQFDVCLLDNDLSEVESSELLASADRLDLPIIPFADVVSPEDEQRALALGAAAFLERGKLDPSMLERTMRFAIHQKKVTDSLARDAFRDERTGLISRTLYRERLDRALVFARRRDCEVAVMHIDLAFEAGVEDSEGLSDTVLAEAGKRLMGALRETDSIARLSDRRLALLIEGIHSLDHAATVARKALRRLRAPIPIDGGAITPVPSLGVAIYPREAADGEPLMRRAEAAMRRAITEGGGCCRFSSERIDYEAREGMVLERAFSIAFERRELRLHFQPEVGLTGKRHGLTCAISWRHPDRGWLPMDDMLADTDDEVLIKGVADWALASAAEQLLAWDRDGLVFPSLSLALPFRRRPALVLLTDAVEDQLGFRNIAAKRITLDLQENLITVDTRRGGADLAALKATGIRLGLNDVGQGRAAIQDLCHDALDSLKLAPDLCRRLGTKGSPTALIRALIDFGHGLGLTVTAKGIDDQQQLAALNRLGCDAVQLSAVTPMPAAAATTWLRAIAKSTVDSEKHPPSSPETLVPNITAKRTRKQAIDTDHT